MSSKQAVIPNRLDAISSSLLDEIRSRLRSSSHPRLRHVECEYHEGIVILRGRVPTYYLKQLAQSVVLSHSKVEELVNQIEVA